MFVRLQLNSTKYDSDVIGPIPHQRAAFAAASIALVIGATLAYLFQRVIGIAPLWAPVVLIPIVILPFAFLITRNQRLSSKKMTAPSGFQTKTFELESIYTHAPLGLCSLDPDLRVTRVNNTMANIFGQSPDALLGHTLQESSPATSLAWDKSLDAILNRGASEFASDIHGNSAVNVGIPRIWAFTFHRIVDNVGALQGINVVAEDVTETRRLDEEHKAHRIILELATSQAPLEKIFETLAAALEVIFPTTLCYIVQSDDDIAAGSLVAFFRGPQQAWVESLFSPRVPFEPNNMLTRSITESREIVISDVSSEPHGPFRDRLMATGIKSCWVKPIILTNKLAWGACVINHRDATLAPTEVERGHLDTLTRLVSAMIERRKLHDQLVSTSERLECAERAGKIGVFDWNPQTGVIVWTKQMENLFGLAAGTFQGTFAHWKRLIHKADVQRVFGTMKELVTKRDPWFKTSHRFLKNNGEYGWMEVQGAISYDPRGSPIRGVGVATDITERKLVEERSRRDQERLNLALEVGGLGFWDWHIPTDEVQFGGSWATMLGYSLDEIAPVLNSWSRLVHPDDLPEARAALERHFRRESAIYECEHRLRKKDGSWTWVLDRGRVVEWDESGKPIRALGIHADITEQRATRESLKTAARRKDEFLATLAHELRNPLAPIRTSLRIIQREPSGEAAARAREIMERQLNHMVRLVDDLLDLSRITRGHMELRKEDISVQDVLDLAIENSKTALDIGGQVFHQEITREEIKVYGDATRLAQIVSNLLVNAAKYTPAGGQILLKAHAANGRIVIEVEDSGAGIPPDMLESVFEMFSQVNSTLDRSQGGLGIGLALARKIAELHGGRVFAKSDGMGKGSTFFVDLPTLPKAANTHQSLFNNGSPRTERHMKKIFIIDDNIDGAASLGMYLEMLGHDVKIFHSGQEALDVIKDRLPEVIFLDIGLPGMNGYEVAKTIRALPGGTAPLIAAATGWGTDDDRRKTAAAGCDVHLTKPIDLAEVERLLV
jgi:PAS domain S-box-containing protein